MEAKIKTSVQFSVTFTVSEDAARTLNVMSQYAPHNFHDFLEGLSSQFKEGGELYKGADEILAIASRIGSDIKRIDAAKYALTKSLENK